MGAILIKGGSFTDSRGTLNFFNEKNPGHYRRFYIINHPDTKIIRAWQGHLVEEKGFYVTSGSFTVAVVCPLNFFHPTDNEEVSYFELMAGDGEFLRVPGGCYTGIKSRTINASLLVLSGLDVEGSKKDDYRQPVNKWVNWEHLPGQ